MQPTYRKLVYASEAGETSQHPLDLGILLAPQFLHPRLKRSAHCRVAWHGTTHVVFEPLDFMARLAALVPRPPFR